MHILITGGTGMIGTALAKSLLADGHQVLVLTRSPAKAHLPQGVKGIGWDGRTSQGWANVINQVDAVVNLVGERLSRWPWTAKQKKRFWESRVEGGKALLEAIRQAQTPPGVLIQASGANYYGPRGPELVTEQDAPGQDFLSGLCQAWEASTKPVEEMGIRHVVIRSGIVLSKEDGILPIIMLPVRLFFGGPLGSGRQGLPWIHLEDEVAAIRFLLENPDARGSHNLTSPEPVSNGEFIRLLARQLRRPFWLPVPVWALRLLLGGMAALVVDGAYLLPGRLQELGFKFRFPDAESAFSDLLGK